MSKHYSGDSAKAFSEFINSEDGKLQQNFIFDYISKDIFGRVLDAACGTGWLAGRIGTSGQSNGKSVEAFDSSEELIAEARANHPKINFKVADIQEPLPYDKSSFDCAVLNMSAHDIENLAAALKNIHEVLKPGGRFIMTIANPYYAYPVGVWKRGLYRFLFGLKPTLRVRSYFSFKRERQSHVWRPGLTSFFYTFSEQLNTALGAGFTLNRLEELESKQDDSRFNLRRQLFDFPTILVIFLEK